MNIVPFRAEETACFLRLAASEQWVSERWECDFLLSAFPQGCFSAQSESGEIVGFVTSLCHDRSGWIGNLVVAEEQRGKRIGEALFTTALGALRAAGVVTYWLTASKSGEPLYEKYGFSGIDRIIRWVGEGRQRHTSGHLPAGTSLLDTSEAAVDSLGWDDRRDLLLAATTERGRVLHDESGFVALQSCGDSIQFGPFAAGHSCGAERLFEAASGTIELGRKVFIDAPASNRAALRMFNRKRMKIVGSSQLMYAGKKPAYRPELIYGLATMGSCG